MKEELENIIKKKEKYVEEHPEQRKLVFRSRRQGQSSKNVAPAGGPEEEEGEHLFNPVYLLVD